MILIYYIIGVIVSTFIGWRKYNVLMIHPVYLLIIICSAIYWPVLLKEYIYEYDA